MLNHIRGLVYLVRVPTHIAICVWAWTGLSSRQGGANPALPRSEPCTHCEALWCGVCSTTGELTFLFFVRDPRLELGTSALYMAASDVARKCS